MEAMESSVFRSTPSEPSRTSTTTCGQQKTASVGMIVRTACALIFGGVPGYRGCNALFLARNNKLKGAGYKWASWRGALRCNKKRRTRNGHIENGGKHKHWLKKKSFDYLPLYSPCHHESNVSSFAAHGDHLATRWGERAGTSMRGATPTNKIRMTKKKNTCPRNLGLVDRVHGVLHRKPFERGRRVTAATFSNACI